MLAETPHVNAAAANLATSAASEATLGLGNS